MSISRDLLVQGDSIIKAYQDDEPFSPLSLNSRVPVYNDNEKEVNSERKHRYQQHFIVEAHIIRPPPVDHKRQILQQSSLKKWSGTSLP